MKRKIIGVKEKVTLFGKKQKTVWARIDTGAAISSIDKTLAKKLGLGPVVQYKTIRQASGKTKRPVIKASIKIGSKRLKGRFTLADRKHMMFDVIIGRGTLKKLNVLVDPAK